MLFFDYKNNINYVYHFLNMKNGRKCWNISFLKNKFFMEFVIKYTLPIHTRIIFCLNTYICTYTYVSTLMISLSYTF